MASMISLAAHLTFEGQPGENILRTEEARFQGIPRFVYGTAFKGDQSTVLVEKALQQGFVGVDTASHTRAYQEKLVGDGIRNLLLERKIKREQIYVR